MISLDEAMMMVLGGEPVDGLELTDETRTQLKEQLAELYGIITGQSFASKTEKMEFGCKQGYAKDRLKKLVTEKYGKKRAFACALKSVDPKMFCGIVKKFEGETAPSTGSSTGNTTPAAGASEYHVPGAMSGFSVGEGFNRRRRKGMKK
jgi:hypothetical protein